MKCEELEIVEDVENNLAKLIVERDAQNTGMLNCRVPSDVVNGPHQQAWLSTCICKKERT